MIELRDLFGPQLEDVEPSVFDGRTTPEVVHRHVIEDDNFQFILVIRKTEKDPLYVSIEAYHRSELERAKKATIQADKEPKPCLYAQGLTISEVNSFINFLGCLNDIGKYVAADSGFRRLLRPTKATQESLEKEAIAEKTAEIEARKDAAPTTTPKLGMPSKNTQPVPAAEKK
jgi:hypothetical protein